MPHIAVSMYPGRTDEQKAALAAELQKTVCRTLSVPPEVVSVSVEDIPRDEWDESIQKIDEKSFYIKPGV